MTAADRSERRRLLPRWRPWQMALIFQETNPVRPRAAPHRFEASLGQALSDWGRVPTSTRAAEVLTAAVSNGSERVAVMEVARKVRDAHANSPLRALADTVLRGNEPTSTWSAPELEFVDKQLDDEAVRAHIAELRSRTRAWPRNPFTWMDLARAYFAQGYDDQALRCVEISLSLDPDNRFVVRSASRFLVHGGDERLAARIVANAAGSKEDPWLLSVAFALDGTVHRPSLRLGKQLIEGGSFSPWHVAELGAVLASREDDNGADRQARRYMRGALIDPNENVLAHAEWASHLMPDGPPAELPRAPYEALARRHARRLEWGSASVYAWQWHLDEPFSAVAAGTGSCYAIHGRNYEQAERMTTAGLKANPGDATLLNNRAFARACRWDLAGAFEDVKSVDVAAAEPNTVGCVMATAGFIAFRSNDPDTGRALYKRAARHFRVRREGELAAMAAINWASEETRIKSAHATEALVTASKAVKNSESPEVSEEWARLEASLPLGDPPPKSVAPQSVASWTTTALGPVADQRDE